MERRLFVRASSNDRPDMSRSGTLETRSVVPFTAVVLLEDVFITEDNVNHGMWNELFTPPYGIGSTAETDSSARHTGMSAIFRRRSQNLPSAWLMRAGE